MSPQCKHSLGVQVSSEGCVPILDYFEIINYLFQKHHELGSPIV